MSRVRMGKVQLRIMRVLWDRGRASAREITELLNQDEPIAHSTVQTLLRKLVEPRGPSGTTRPSARLSSFPASPRKTCAGARRMISSSASSAVLPRN